MLQQQQRLSPRNHHVQSGGLLAWELAHTDRLEAALADAADSYLHVNLTARTSRTPSTIAPQSRPGLRAIRNSTCRRDCRTRRSITGCRRLSVPFIRPGCCSARPLAQRGRGGRLVRRGTQLSWIGHRCCWCVRYSNAVRPTFLPHVDFSLPQQWRKGQTVKCCRRQTRDLCR